jgi:CheY-like chemotaxis protein
MRLEHSQLCVSGFPLQHLSPSPRLSAAWQPDYSITIFNIAGSEHQARAKQPLTLEPLVKPTLLIAEGDAELCDIYQKILKGCGYEVTTASDGLGCLEKLCQDMPKVLVLDLELSWGGGDGILARLREQYTYPDVSVVLTTGSGLYGDNTTDHNPPVVKLLPKPFMLTDLLESVNEATFGRR